MKAIAKLFLPILLVSFQSNAIVIRHDKTENLYSINNDEYPSVVNLEFLMGTLIAPQWIVTAAHGTPLMPGQQKITIGENQYTVTNIIVFPDYNPQSNSMEYQQDHDLALIKLDRPVIGIKPSQLYKQTNERAARVTFVGNGYTGNGKDGLTGPSSGYKRATNIVDIADKKWLHFDFDSPENHALDLEGVSGPGDSGGPAFIATPSGFRIAGISSHQLDNSSGLANVYGVSERYTRISSYIDWIESTMLKTEHQLDQVSLQRPLYKKLETSTKEKTELLGRYQVKDMPIFIIEPCSKTLCYRWEGQPRLTAIYQAQKALWFTTNIHRTIEIIRNKSGKVEKLYFDGYQGDKYAIKQ